MKKLTGLWLIMLFASSTSLSNAGDIIFYEDFSSYKEGELPAGWIGGENLAVKIKKRKKVLSPFVEGDYDVTTKNIEFPSNFFATVILKDYSRYSNIVFRIFFGNYTIVKWASNIRTYVNGKRTITKNCNVSKGKTYSLSLKKDGVIYSLFINGNKFFTGRYPGLEMSNIRFKSDPKFEIESITIEKL